MTGISDNGENEVDEEEKAGDAEDNAECFGLFHAFLALLVGGPHVRQL